MKSRMCLKQNLYTSVHRSVFSFVHLRRSPDCPSLKKLSSLCESKVANTYVDKGSSNVAHKSFQLLLQNIFTTNFRRFRRYLNIKKATVFEKFSNPWKRWLWVRANNLQIMFTIQVLNRRSKQVLLKAGSDQNKLLKKSILKQKCASDKNQILSKSVWPKIYWSSSNFIRAKRHQSWRHQSVARNLDQTLDLQPNRRKKPRL